jgi:hypothetical protein
LRWKIRKWSSQKVGDYPSSSRLSVCSLDEWLAEKQQFPMSGVQVFLKAIGEALGLAEGDIGFKI